MRSGLILAGGASRRFGRPKAFEAVRGRAMVAWVADALETRTGELVVSVADDDQTRRMHALLPKARIVADERRDRGPIEGLDRGLRAARGDLVLVAPCDAPLLKVTLLDLLLERIGGHDAAVPRLAAFDPVRAVYRRATALRVLDADSDRIGSPSALVDRLDAAFVDEADLRAVDPDLSSFVDVNALDDLARAEAAY